MANRDRKCVSDIGWFGNVVQCQMSGNGQLDLSLGCSPVAGKHFLDLSRGVGDKRQVALASRQTDDTASVSHDDGCLRTLVVAVKLLQSHAVWLERINYVQQTVMNRL